MRREKLTIRLLNSLQPGTEERIADTETRGLQVWTRRTAVCFYFVAKHKGRQFHQALGRFPEMTLEEARRAVLDKMGALVNYGDIQAPSARKDPVLREAFALWLARQKNKASSTSAIKCWAHLAERRIVDIRPEEISAVFRAMRETPAAANHAVRYLGTAVNLMRKKLHIQLPDLVSHIERYPTAPRTRIMREDEAPKVFAKLKELTGRPLYAEQAEALLLMVYTGQRKSRVLALSADQIDEEFRIWHVPGSRTKIPHDHAFNDYAWAIVKRRLRKHPSGPLFRWKGKQLREVRKTFLKVCRDLGIEDLHIHDLRRSLGSWMLSSGATIEEVSKTLGHASIRTTETVYAHLLQSTGRAATTTAIEAMSSGQASPGSARAAVKRRAAD